MEEEDEKERAKRRKKTKGRRMAVKMPLKPQAGNSGSRIQRTETPGRPREAGQGKDTDWLSFSTRKMVVKAPGSSRKGRRCSQLQTMVAGGDKAH
ncbi:hypothetical protein PoB_007263400 [Plakobranchus ocellatus]|uniref:Uncharacterized protein n=1 Tax=Plakobranchus ocellatus TaxID=259542 RepID=A0AAV4DPP4_9GAST|nr:hypothetical protein PoB_007263400 [Plakobranchus ocellatus]